MPGLFEAFAGLPCPDALSQGDGFFSAVAVPGFSRYRIAKDSKGAPALLISVSSPRSGNAPILLENLTIQFDTNCRVLKEDKEHQPGQFIVIRCTAEDPTLREYFLRVCDPLVATLGDSPDQHSVVTALDNLVSLFSALTLPPRKSVQGLWAELFCISRSSNPAEMARAWHRDPDERYDFSSARQKIEVKSAGGRVRKHHFSLDQLQPPKACTLLFVSILVERSGGGTSVADLLGTIRRALSESPDLLMHLEGTVIRTLGQSWHNAMDDHFDAALAAESLRFFTPESIPCIPLDIPPQVSQVHFVADLSNIPPIAPESFRSQGDLFGIM